MYFDGVVRNSLDEWIYFLRNTEIESEFTAQGLDVAAECLALYKLGAADWEDYEDSIKDRRIRESELKTAFHEGFAEGFVEGLEIARKAKKLRAPQTGPC